MNGGDRGGVRIILFSEVTLFKYNVSTILSPIVRKCESKHWYACGADGRTDGRLVGHVIIKFSGMGRFTHGATLARFALGAPLKSS